MNCRRSTWHLAGVFALLLLPAISMAQETEAEAETKPIAIATMDGKSVAKLAPENTRIEFIGTHVGDDPKPRLGGFKKFTGTIGIEDGHPVSVEVEMEIASIWTEFDNLTKHLMNADFFEAAKFPNAGFKSTSVTIGEAGTCTVAGQLTLHGTTGDFEFPAKYEITDSGLVLMADFKLDRTKFGMDQMTDGVEKEVSLSVVVGQPTKNMESNDGNGSDDSNVSLKISLPNMS